MNKELSLLTIIRLDTELENALGNFTHAMNTNNFTEMIVWENEMHNILNEIETLGDTK